MPFGDEPGDSAPSSFWGPRALSAKPKPKKGTAMKNSSLRQNAFGSLSLASWLLGSLAPSKNAFLGDPHRLET